MGCLQKMARYPSSLESTALFLSHPLSSCSRSSSSRSSSRSTTAICSSSTHLPSAISLAAASRWRQGCIMRRKGPCYLAWYALSNGNIRNNTIIVFIRQRLLYFRPARNCEHIRNIWLASSGTVIAAWNRVRLVNARRGPGLLAFAYIRARAKIAHQSLFT